MLAERERRYFKDFSCAHLVVAEMRGLHESGAVNSPAWVAMPGHVYWLFQLGEAETLSSYRQYGHSTERNFVYVTTANLTREQWQQLSDEDGVARSLLVLCTAFRGRGDYPNLTVKKIPKQVLSRCEWGHDDYPKNGD